MLKTQSNQTDIPSAEYPNFNFFDSRRERKQISSGKHNS